MVFKTQNCPWPLYQVLRQTYIQKPIRTRLSQLFKNQFDCLITPLFSDQHLSTILQHHNKIDQSDQQLVSTDNLLQMSSIPSQQQIQNINEQSHLRNIYLQINDILNLSYRSHRKIFRFIVGYAVYLGLYAIVIKMPSKKQQNKWEGFIKAMNKYSQRQLFGELHLILLIDCNEQDSQQNWQNYILLRNQIDNNSKNKKISLKIDLMLYFNSYKQIPSQKKIQKWIGERIDYVLFGISMFKNNTKGLPILTDRIQSTIKKLFKYKIKIVLQNDCQLKQNNKVQWEIYTKFLQFMFQKQSKPTSKQLDSIDMRDKLQIPLQPYYDNLEAATYQVFEKDNAKYDQYQIALVSAFLSFPQQKKIVIFYIGSGRGALIYRCMAASKKTKRDIFIYAIQKNPYPIQALKRRIRINKWQKNVEIVFTDIKNWKPPQTADIFLSELLGGFGDNQLSPECLFWAENHLQKNTICIPYQYSSFIRPISCSNLYRTLVDNQKQNYFVVNLHNYSTFSSAIKCWTFNHPLQINENFKRLSKINFNFPNSSALIHGFAGYFSCQLYGTARYSIVPGDETPDMYSWYPIFFSFNEPIYIQKGGCLQIQIERCVDQKRVWYEWSYEYLSKQNKNLNKKSKIHNKFGHSHSIFK